MTATLTINPARNAFETVTIIRKGTGVLTGWTRIERLNGGRVWVPSGQLKTAPESRPKSESMGT